MKVLQICLMFLLVGCFACSKKQKMFTRLSAKQTGINFANNIVESDSFNIFTFEYIYNGSGVGVGDFNNDGLQDVYFAGNEVTSKLYINKGDFKFEDITTASGTATRHWCTGVAVVDINADGWDDIYVNTAFTDPKKPAPNLFFINRGLNKEGLPVFEEAAAAMGLNDSAYGTQAAFFDYDRDGDLDVYLCINSGKESDRNELRGQRIDGRGLSQDKLFRNEGFIKGKLPRFTNVSANAGIQIEGWGLGLVVKDINKDGWPDVYVANDFQSNDHLYINNKNGTFTNKVAEYLAHQCHNAMGVDIADFNNDALEDICVVDMLPEDNMRQKTMFGAIPNDKYAASLRMGYQPQFVRNVLQLNNGPLPDSSDAVSFSDIGYMSGIAATDWSWSPLFADFDLDGWKDLLITNGYVKDITDLDFATYANEYGMFGTPESRIQRLRKKVKEMGEVKKRNWLFLNNRHLGFTDKAVEFGLEEISFSNGTAYVDFDNDGDLDIVMNNLNDDAFLYRNNSEKPGRKEKIAASNYLKIKLIGEAGNRHGLGAKISVYTHVGTQYAEQAMQRGYLSSIDERVNFGLGSALKIDSLVVSWPSGKQQMIRDIPANQLLVLHEKDAVISTGLEAVNGVLIKGVENLVSYLHEENEYLDFLYQYTLPHRYSLQGPSLAVGDIDGDGLDDIYIGGSSRHSGSMLLQRAEGFQQRRLTNKPEQKLQEETGTLLFDADNDGDNDLYCVAGGNEFGHHAAYQDLLFLNDGKGNLSQAIDALPNTEGSGSCVVAADMDHDGDLDLFVGGRNKPHQYPLTSRSYLLRNDTDPTTKKVRFTDVTIQWCALLVQPGMVTAALWTDYNNDGLPDLVIAGEFMPIRIFRNEKGRQLVALPSAALQNSNGWYNSITAGDFDNDGDMDYVAGNLGLNSRFKASMTEPVTVRYNDFNKDGALDAFLFAYNNGKEFPTLTRTTLVEQISSLKKRIFYHSDYGKMGYKELFSSAERDGAKELVAFQLASVYIENKGGGNFALKPLPMAAQIAPINGVLPYDIDDDGNLDILAIGNSYAPEALSGRYDAAIGWVLKGDGEGTFVPLSSQQSGFVVRGDARSLVKFQRADRTSMIMASVNSGPLKLFQEREKRNILSLPRGTVYALYALANGKQRKEEFFYGSSYLSQSGRFITLDKHVKKLRCFGQDGKIIMERDLQN